MFESIPCRIARTGGGVGDERGSGVRRQGSREAAVAIADRVGERQRSGRQATASALEPTSRAAAACERSFCCGGGAPPGGRGMLSLSTRQEWVGTPRTAGLAGQVTRSSSWATQSVRLSRPSICSIRSSINTHIQMTVRSGVL